MNDTNHLELINAWLDGDVDAAQACAKLAASSPELVAEARAQRRMHLMLWAQLTSTTADTVVQRVKILDSGTATRRKSVQKIMRRIHPRSPLVWLGWSLAATLLVLVIGGLLAWPRLTQIADVERAGGVVQRDQQTIPVYNGFSLHANDEIQAITTVRLHFNDGTIFTLEPGSSLRLLAGQHHLGGGAKRAELLNGHLLADAAHQPNGEPLIIVTPDIEITVIGNSIYLALEH